MELEVVVKIVVNEFLSYKISLFKNIFLKNKNQPFDIFWA